MIKKATFCTGIGSPEFAIEEIGVEHEIVFACEIDKYARASYQSRFKPKRMLEDMTQVDFSDPELYADLVVAGLPCQAFSIAGKRLGELDKRGILIYNFHDYVKKQQPKAFILENVKGLKSINKGEIFENWQRILGRSVNGVPIDNLHPDSLEYNLYWKVLNTKNFDLPQNRERVFIVGIRKDLPAIYAFPENRDLNFSLKNILEKQVDEKYYFSDKMLNYLSTRKANFNGGRINYKHEEDIASCINASSKSVDISDNIIVVKQEGVIGIKAIFNRLDANYHKGLDNHSQRSAILNKGSIRKLTPLECWRLQGYSDEYFYQAQSTPMSDTQLYKQAGNSMSTTVIKAVMEPLINLIELSDLL